MEKTLGSDIIYSKSVIFDKNGFTTRAMDLLDFEEMARSLRRDESTFDNITVLGRRKKAHMVYTDYDD